MRIVKAGFFLALIILGGSSMPLWAEGAPALRVEVRNAAGNIMPSAGQIEMIDARNPNGGIVRTAEVGGDGVAFFKSEDFMGFIVSGMSDEGETQRIIFDGKNMFPQSRFKVQLTLTTEEFGPKSYTVHVSADSPAEYIFTLS